MFVRDPSNKSNRRETSSNKNNYNGDNEKILYQTSQGKMQERECPLPTLQKNIITHVKNESMCVHAVDCESY